MIHEYIQSNQERFLSELFDLLRIPSVSADSQRKADVRRAADYVQQKLKEAGADKVELYETKGHPIVYGEKVVNAAFPTVLVYGHYDVQPADPLPLWNSPPFELSWGPYQDPDPEEESAIVQTVIALQSSGLCTDKVAVTMLKSVMRIENVDVYLKELEKSREEKANKEREANELTANSDHARQMEMVQTQAALKPKPPKAGKQ